MRALLLQLLFLLCVPMITIAPHIGVLMYYWFTWLNPHRLIWGGFPIDWGKLIAITTIIFLIFSKEKKKLPADPIVVLIITLFLWTSVTTFFAEFGNAAVTEYIVWTKVVLMVLIATVLINDKHRLHAMVWIVCISIGFFGGKGGIFFVLSGGNYYVFGPPKSAIHNTNEIARAFLMTIPLMYYLALQSHYKYTRYVMYLVTMLTILALFGTTSRTAFLVFAAMLFFWWLRSRSKFKIALAGITVSAIVLAVIPEERLSGLAEKYQSSADYSSDNSFQHRVETWNFIVEKIANKSPITGGGFKAVLKSKGLEPHSNYFQVLGEHGYVGLSIYLILCLVALLQTNRIYNRTKREPTLYWARDLALMLQISFIGYLLGGITKNHAFFEFFYMQLAMLVALERIVSAEPAKRTAPVVPNAMKVAEGRVTT